MELSPTIHTQFKRLPQEEPIPFTAINNDIDATLDLLKSVFFVEPTISDGSSLQAKELTVVEYDFILQTADRLDASELLREKIALNYCLPKIRNFIIAETAALQTKEENKATQNGIKLDRRTIIMSNYLPQEIKADFETKLYELICEHYNLNRDSYKENWKDSRLKPRTRFIIQLPITYQSPLLT